MTPYDFILERIPELCRTRFRDRRDITHFRLSTALYNALVEEGKSSKSYYPITTWISNGWFSTDPTLDVALRHPLAWDVEVAFKNQDYSDPVEDVEFD